MAKLVDELKELLRVNVLKRISSDPPSELASMGLYDLLIIYGTWQCRQLSQSPRRVHISQELLSSAEHSAQNEAFDAIVTDIKCGNDLNRYLSRASETTYEPMAGRPARLQRRRDRDLLLADWGVHHMHLSTSCESDGFVTRTDDLLFVAFVQDDAYLIGIYPHGSWAPTEVLEIFVRNWGGGGLLQSVSGFGLAESFTDEERLQMRNAGMTVLIEIDGAVYMPPGQTSAGTPISVGSSAQHLLCKLDELEAAIDADASYLDSFLDEESRPRYMGFEWEPYVSDGEFGFKRGQFRVPLGQFT